jgi:hypothetical protein
LIALIAAWTYDACLSADDITDPLTEIENEYDVKCQLTRIRDK